MYQINFILEWHSTCFGRSFRPSSAVQDCTYSCQTDTAVCTVLNCWFYFGMSLYMFRTVFPSICCLLASKQTAVSVWQLYVQSWTADDGRKDRPKHVVSFQNKINWYTGAPSCYAIEILYVASKQTAVSVWQLYVQSRTADDGRKDRPKHIECHSKIKLIWYIGASSWFCYGNWQIFSCPHTHVYLFCTVNTFLCSLPHTELYHTKMQPTFRYTLRTTYPLPSSRPKTLRTKSYKFIEEFSLSL